MNPGQYNQEGDESILNKSQSQMWNVNANDASAIVYNGRVGINTDITDQALNVCGNIKVTGAVLQPSDIRVKTDIKEVNFF